MICITKSMNMATNEHLSDVIVALYQNQTKSTHLILQLTEMGKIIVKKNHEINKQKILINKLLQQIGIQNCSSFLCAISTESSKAVIMLVIFGGVLLSYVRVSLYMQ